MGGLWLVAYSMCAALPFAGAGFWFLNDLPKELPKELPTASLFMPSSVVLSLIALFLLVCGIIGFIFERSSSVHQQTMGKALRVSSLCGTGFVIMPLTISALNLLGLK